MFAITVQWASKSVGAKIPIMRVYVGVTDTEWYEFLAAHASLTEVNFWNPSGRPLMNLEIGEPFLFKSKSPHNRLVGGGFYNGFIRLPISDAWRIFGPANGVPSLERLRERIAAYRRESVARMGDPEIGCTMINDTTFFHGDLRPPLPVEWGRGLVRGKSFTGVEAESIIEVSLKRMLSGQGPRADSVPGDVFGDPHLAAARLGQRPFQALVLDAYHRRCAITGEKIRPVLQAAHILPVSFGGQNRVDNGLLLRSDVHTLFDQGYLSVDTTFKIRVSPRIRTEFHNGEEYYRLARTPIALPERHANWPRREFLEWHNDVRFLAS